MRAERCTASRRVRTDTLLIAAEKGLFRFDGLSFASIVPTSGPERTACSASPRPTATGCWRESAATHWSAFRGGAFEDVMPAHNFLGIVRSWLPAGTGRS